MVVNGATNKEVFKIYVEKFLLPSLDKGDVVILDNLSAHKGKEIRELIESAGAEIWFLPPYSPELMPMERVWQWMRQHDLSNRLFENEAAIDRACHDSWHKLTPDRLQTITDTDWITHGGQG